MNKMIMIMVDGFGIPQEGWTNSIYAESCSEEFIDLFSRYSIPLDATLGVSRVPQSATGQTTLFGGVNAAKIIGTHYPAFPGPELQATIKEKNIFKDLIKKVLNTLSRFILTIKEKLPENTYLLITSDHGNCEDLSSPIHSNNPVPLMLYSKKQKLLDEQKTTLNKAKSIVDVYDLIVNILCPN